MVDKMCVFKVTALQTSKNFSSSFTNMMQLFMIINSEQIASKLWNNESLLECQWNGTLWMHYICWVF